MSDETDPLAVLRIGLERLEQTRGRTPAPCRIERLMTNELDPMTADVLRRLVEDSDVPVQRIREQLAAAGKIVGWGTIKQHRLKICTCRIGEGQL